MFWSPWRNVWFIRHIRSGAHVPHPSERSPLWASQQRSQVIHVGHTSNSAGFSLNISSRFNACEILYWHGCDIVIYARRQFCKYLGIFAFIIRDIHFLVPLSVHFFFSGQSSFLMQLSLSGSEDNCALSCVLLEVKTSEAASQVPEARAGVCCVCCVRSVMRTECQLLLLINFSSFFLQMWKFWARWVLPPCQRLGTYFWNVYLRTICSSYLSWRVCYDYITYSEHILVDTHS